MNISLVNSLGGRREEFVPPAGRDIKMYTCGVTVYDDCHVGHARSLYVFEVIRRFLNVACAPEGKRVRLIRNITDVDDKIIQKAQAVCQKEQCSLTEAFDRVRTRYIESYYEDLKLLELPAADLEPKATEHIPQMLEYIRQLIARGVAYEAAGNVYFSVRKFPSYGLLSGKKIDDLLTSVRIEPDPHKRDPLDFALWKSAKQDEPSWQSPWGLGRPGWHIECSVMSQRLLDTATLDIHGGGRDLVFPHHENERAQSEAMTGKVFARYWIHHGLLTINGQKMAKSLGNFFTIKDVLRKYHPDVLKLLFLHAHYASPVDFSWDKMEEAQRAYERLDIFRGKLQRYLAASPQADAQPSPPAAFSRFRDEFMAALADDFNMPQALAAVFEATNECNKLLDASPVGACAVLQDASLFLKEASQIFCLTFSKAQDGVTEQEIEIKIQERLAFKKTRNFSAADALRDELQKQGVILEDTKDGTTWRRSI